MTDEFDLMVDNIFDQGEEENPKFQYKKKPGKMAIPEKQYIPYKAARNDYYPKYFTRQYQDRTQGQPVTNWTNDIKIKWCKKCGLSNMETTFVGDDQICLECKNW